MRGVVWNNEVLACFSFIYEDRYLINPRKLSEWNISKLGYLLAGKLTKEVTREYHVQQGRPLATLIILGFLEILLFLVY